MPAKSNIHKLYGGDVEIEYHEGEKMHWFTHAGTKNRIDSVTSITGLLDKSGGLIPWALGCAKTKFLQYLETASGNSFSREELYPIIEEAIVKYREVKDEAAAIGTAVHDYAEAFGKAKIAGTALPEIDPKWDDRVLNGVMAFLDWYNDSGYEFASAERIIYSKEHNYAGKMDVHLIDKKTKEEVPADYKTGKGVYSEAHYQLAGYWSAIEEEANHKLPKKAKRVEYPYGLILHFDKLSGGFKAVRIERADYLKNLTAFLGFRQVRTREKELSKW